MLQGNFVSWDVAAVGSTSSPKYMFAAASNQNAWTRAHKHYGNSPSHARTHTHIHTLHSYAMDTTTPGNAPLARRSTRARRDSHHIIEQREEQQAVQENLKQAHTRRERQRQRRNRESFLDEHDAEETPGHNHGHDHHMEDGHHQEEEGKETGGNQDDHASKTHATTTGTGAEPATNEQGGVRPKKPRRSHAEEDSKDDPRHHSKATRGRKQATAARAVRHSSRPPKISEKRQAIIDKNNVLKPAPAKEEGGCTRAEAEGEEGKESEKEG